MAVSAHDPAPVRCERARHWASLRLDGELSALEARLLERHVAGCEACRAFDAGIVDTATRLRETPVEAPSRRFVPPRVRGVSLPLGKRRAALVVAAALALGAVTGSLLQRPAGEPERVAPQFSFLSRDVKQLQQLPRATTKTTPAPVRSGPPNPPEGVI